MEEHAREGWPVVAQVNRPVEIADALSGVSIGRGRPVLIIVGGASGMGDDAIEIVEEALRRAVLPVVEECGAAVIDGGTDSGVMRAVGQARSKGHSVFPLVGVAARGTVVHREASPVAGAAEIDRHHTHLLLVPGTKWGDEGPWLADVAEVLAGDRRSVTLLVNGGDIAYDDVDRSLARGRPVIVLAGTGRTADTIADAAEGRTNDSRARRIAQSRLTRVVPIEDFPALRVAVRQALGISQAAFTARDRQVDVEEAR